MPRRALPLPTPAPDGLGITSSVLCTLHCAVLPLVLPASALPGLEGWNYLFLLISAVAVWQAATRARSQALRWGLWAGLALLAAALLLEAHVPGLHYLAYAASAGLIALHVANLRARRARPAADCC